MSETAITTSPKPPSVVPEPVIRTERSSRAWFVRYGLAPAGSLRWTVALFALAILLVFFGTLAQIDEGIFTVLKKYFRTPIAWIPLQVFVRFGQVFLWVPPTAKVAGSFPFPGGQLLGGLLMVNLFAAHSLLLVNLSRGYGLSRKLGTALLKRSGIFVLHGGIVLLMLGELVTTCFSVESRMSIVEGRSTNYAEDNRAAELVVIDPSDPKSNDVVAIPASLLVKNRVVQNDALPFDVELVRYMSNSAFPDRPVGDQPNPATAGDGLRFMAIEESEVSGTSSDQRVDVPSAYVTFKRKGTGELLGTYMLSAWLSAEGRSEHVVVDGKTYDVALRFKRAYKPYTLHLIQFRHDKYMGTDVPMNYSSRIDLVDREEGQEREVVISMNNPLRYRGDTYYQADFLRPPGPRGTVLQVVRNPGWEIPYVACAMVALGMLIHFSLHLVGFIRRRIA
jgi:hypothetical protein